MKGRVPLFKDNITISKEWDDISEFRSNQLYNNEDISMDHVLIPTILNMAVGANFSNVIDLGCGTGYSTYKFASKAEKITGIDLSQKSIIEAKKKLEKDTKNIRFQKSSIEDFSVKNEMNFTLAISNMTFMDVVNLKDVLKSTNKLLSLGSKLIITITHPFFWPLYWGYASKDWFDYSKEIEIEGKFSISLKKTEITTTHIHRPLGLYLKLLLECGFKIEEILEPMPSIEIQELYPKKWEYPRFLAIKCIKEE